MAPIIDDADELLRAKEPSVNFSVRIPVSLKKRLGALAKHRGIKESRVINFILAEGVGDLEKHWGLKK